MSEPAPPPADWTAGLTPVGTCPHCGVPVYVRADERNATTGLPVPVYLCACRVLSALPRPPVPRPAPPAPVAPGWGGWDRWPCAPVSPAVPSQPWCPNSVGPWVPPEYPTPGPGFPPTVTCAAEPPHDTGA